jgi:hypothetical protein
VRTFNHFPKQDKCLLCGKNDDKECVLAGVDDTQKGNNEQAIPIHTDCIKLRYNKNVGVFYQMEVDR